MPEVEGHAKGHTDSRLQLQLFIPRPPFYLPVFLNNLMIYGREKRAMERQKRMQLILLGMREA